MFTEQKKGLLPVCPHPFSILPLISFSKNEEKQVKKPWKQRFETSGFASVLNQNSLVPTLTRSPALYMRVLQAKRGEIALAIYSWLRIALPRAANPAVDCALTAHDI